MLFHSARFFIFLPIVFTAYWLLFRSQPARKLFLFLASCVFYMSWNPKLIVLLWASTFVDYFTVRAMGATDSTARRRALLALSIVFNLGILVIFKYANFLLGNAGAASSYFGWGWSPGRLSVVLPLGISFYTFETISYVIDGYYKKNRPCRTLFDYGLFISFFPHLIAGPIVRPKQFVPQLDSDKELRAENVSVGVAYFLYGLFKKLVIADNLARIVDAAFSAPGGHGTASTWLAVVAYAMQIYCDFSGYSSMAYGLARLFDYQLPVNFRTPYLARNVSEFWKRWHISLSMWLRDYLYSPLRGDRKDEWTVHKSLFLTMLLGGLWHGANWTFVVWGAYHGLLLMIHRALHQTLGGAWKPIAERVPRPLREAGSRLLVFALICVGWVFFRSPTLAGSAVMLNRLFVPIHGPALEGSAAAVALILTVLALDSAEYAAEQRGLDVDRAVAGCHPALRVAGYALLIAALTVLLPASAQPFIYFQF